MALLFSGGSQEQLQLNGFEVVSITDVELAVTESSRPGAPMTLIRGGEERDLAAITAMGQVRASPFRFHLAREVASFSTRSRKSDCLQGSARPGRVSCISSSPKKASPPQPMSSSASSEAHGRSRNVATGILLERALVPSYKRSSHVNPSSVARRSALGSLTASYRRR